MEKYSDMHIHVREGLANFDNYINMIKYAEDKNIDNLVFLEHGFRISEKHTPILNTQNIADKLKRDINLLRIQYPNITLKSGIEIDYSKDNSFRQKTIEYLRKAKFDVVIGAIHSMKLNSNGYYSAIIDMIENYPIDIIAHIKLYDNYQKQPLLNEIITLCKKKNIKIEINTSERSIWNEEQMKYMIGMILSCGVKYSIGSDAHRINEIGQNFTKVHKYINKYKGITKSW